MASNIVLSPNCVSTTVKNSSHCTPEYALTARFTESRMPNAVFPMSTGLVTPGSGSFRFLWGQWAYASLGNQYNFTGTSINITDVLELSLPNL